MRIVVLVFKRDVLVLVFFLMYNLVWNFNFSIPHVERNQECDIILGKIGAIIA